MDSYEVARKILELWSNNCNKSSGKLNKDDLSIPIYFKDFEFHSFLTINDVYITNEINGQPSIILSECHPQENC